MRIAPIAAKPARDVFTLRVQLTPDRKQAALELIAPDRVIERRETLALDDRTRLATISAFATKLPRFLNTAHTSGDWVGLIGTTDASAYDVLRQLFTGSARSRRGRIHAVRRRSNLRAASSASRL